MRPVRAHPPNTLRAFLCTVKHIHMHDVAILVAIDWADWEVWAWFLGVLYQLNQFGRHRSQAIEMSEKFRKSQVTLGLSEWVPDMVTEGQKVEFPPLVYLCFLAGM